MTFRRRWIKVKNRTNLVHAYRREPTRCYTRGHPTRSPWHGHPCHRSLALSAAALVAGLALSLAPTAPAVADEIRRRRAASHRVAAPRPRCNASAPWCAPASSSASVPCRSTTSRLRRLRAVRTGYAAPVVLLCGYCARRTAMRRGYAGAGYTAIAYRPVTRYGYGGIGCGRRALRHGTYYRDQRPVAVRRIEVPDPPSNPSTPNTLALIAARGSSVGPLFF